MTFNSVNIVNGSELGGPVIQSIVTGTQLPSPPTAIKGAVFYLTVGNPGVYLFDGTTWQLLSATSFSPSFSPALGAYVQLIGDTMTGPLVLSADPVVGLGAVTKQYVDNLVSIGGPAVTTPGTYTKVTVNSSGKVLSGTSPTTLAGYGITDAQPLSSILSSLSNIPLVQGVLTIGPSGNIVIDASTYLTATSNATITGSWSFSSVTGPDPILPAQLATKNYVDGVASGVTPMRAVNVATTTNIALSGLQTIDGVLLAAGDRVLVKDQTTGTQNGTYTVAAGAWSRTADFDGTPASEVGTGALFYVEFGTTNGNSSWILVTPSPVINTTPLTFSVFSRVGDYTAGNGLVKTGNQFAVATASPARIISQPGSIDLATTGIAPGSYAYITVDAYGRATSGSLTLPWSSISGTPTSLAGYGITDAQPLNANLTGLSLLDTSGLVAGLGTFVTRTIIVTGAGLSIINPDGVGGNPTITSNGTSSATPSTLVARDVAGSFAGNVITATSFVGDGSRLTGIAAGSSSMAVTSTNLAGGAAGSIPYQSAPSVTAFVSPGTSSQVLAGGTTPAWTSSPTIIGTNFISIPNGALTNSSITVTAGTGLTGGGTVALGSTVVLSLSPSISISGSFSGSGSGLTGLAPALSIGGSAASLQTAQTISTSGDATGTSQPFNGTSPVTIPLTLATINSTPGTFGSGTTTPVISVNSKGLVTSITSVTSAPSFSALTSTPTTLAGYGITDAQPLSANLTAISNLTTSGIVVGTNPGTFTTRSIQVSGIGLSLVNADGSVGNPVIISNATSSALPSTLVSRDSSGNTTMNSVAAATFTSTTGPLLLQAAGTTVVTIDTSGNLVATGNVSAYSDARLKTDLQVIPNALDKVGALTGYTFTRKDTGARQTGLIAQAVQEVLPEAVLVGDDAEQTLSVAYGSMVGLLVEAIKELQAEVAELKAKLNS